MNAEVRKQIFFLKAFVQATIFLNSIECKLNAAFILEILQPNRNILAALVSLARKLYLALVGSHCSVLVLALHVLNHVLVTFSHHMTSIYFLMSIICPKGIFHSNKTLNTL